MEDSKIAWTDNTFNPWIGCTRVSAGCEHCYAEVQNNRFKWNGGTWGPGAPRKINGDKTWGDPVAWNARAVELGKRLKVFCASLADIFDDEGPVEARNRLWQLVSQTPNLDWLILTKRPENFQKYLPVNWGAGYENVWLGVTCENHKQGFPRVELLTQTPAKVRFLSCEPLLEDVSDVNLASIDWVIVGGESGPKSRNFKVEWARMMRDHCRKEGVTFFMKQLGSAPTEAEAVFPILQPGAGVRRDDHGSNLANFPPDLRVQAWPTTAAPEPLCGPPAALTAGQKAAATRKRNAKSKMAEVGMKQGLQIVSSCDGQVDIQAETPGLLFEEFEHVVEWLHGWCGAAGPIGYVAQAASMSLAAMTELLAGALESPAKSPTP